MENKFQKFKMRINDKINDALFQNLISPKNFFMPSRLKTEKHFSEMQETANYVVASGGKRWRSILLVLCANSCKEKIPKNKRPEVFNLAASVELIHTASLIHDDIEDSSELRRGKPAAHIKFGCDTALNSGSWLYFSALNLIENLPLKKSEKYFMLMLTIQAIYNLHLGQAMDISWHRDENFYPSILEYEKMISLKTGTLASLAGALGVYFASNNKTQSLKLSKAMCDFGIAFQVLDDIKNITTGILGKDRGDDIVEGKKSLPVILKTENNPDAKEKLSMYFKQAKKEGINSKAVSNAIEFLTCGNSIKRAEAYANKKIITAKRQLLNIFPKSKNRKDLLQFINKLIPVDIKAIIDES